jgi:hypothetical protein
MNYKTDYVSSINDMLITQFKYTLSGNAENNLAKFLRPMSTQLQEIEDVIESFVSNISLDDCVGIQLDNIGSFLSEPRNGLSDTDYRVLLKFKPLFNKSYGEESIIKDTLKIRTASTNVSLLEIGRVTAIVDFDGEAISHNLVGQIKDAKTAGHNLLLQSSGGLNPTGLMEINDIEPINFGLGELGEDE